MNPRILCKSHKKVRFFSIRSQEVPAESLCLKIQVKFNVFVCPGKIMMTGIIEESAKF
jgi:hypothetical protein